MLIEILNKGDVYILVKDGVELLESPNLTDILSRVSDLLFLNEGKKFISGIIKKPFSTYKSNLSN